MLVLNRKKGERIFIGDGLIKITVNKINGDSVSISIDAPRDVTVDREEVARRKDAKNDHKPN